ncbi:hypothetical protein Gbfr_022_034 [Gluconobacter frateurii M-2]|nr:hypothetical protein Gbfr_022_034 [Gluconobacter frateurii M-2]
MSEEQQDDPGTIEVGCTPSTGLRLWLAKEAQRHGEKKLETQYDMLERHMERATACIGWSFTLAGGLAAAVMASKDLSCLKIPMVEAALAAVAATVVILPSGWGLPSDSPNWIMDQPYASELEMCEALALRSEMNIDLNARRLKSCGFWLRTSAVLMTTAAALAAVLAF